MQIEYDNQKDTEHLLRWRLFGPSLGSLYEEGKNDMENIDNLNPVASEVSPEEAAKLVATMEEMAGQPVSLDAAEETDEQRVLN